MQQNIYPPPPVQEPSVDEEYEIEAIVGKRTRKGKICYKVKWVGYGSEDNTWEPLEHLQNCLGKIQTYEAEQSAKRKRKRKEKRREALKRSASKEASKSLQMVDSDSGVNKITINRPSKQDEDLMELGKRNQNLMGLIQSSGRQGSGSGGAGLQSNKNILQPQLQSSIQKPVYRNGNVMKPQESEQNSQTNFPDPGPKIESLLSKKRSAEHEHTRHQNTVDQASDPSEILPLKDLFTREQEAQDRILESINDITIPQKPINIFLQPENPKSKTPEDPMEKLSSPSQMPTDTNHVYDNRQYSVLKTDGVNSDGNPEVLKQVSDLDALQAAMRQRERSMKDKSEMDGQDGLSGLNPFVSQEGQKGAGGEEFVDLKTGSVERKKSTLLEGQSGFEVITKKVGEIEVEDGVGKELKIEAEEQLKQVNIDDKGSQQGGEVSEGNPLE